MRKSTYFIFIGLALMLASCTSIELEWAAYLGIGRILVAGDDKDMSSTASSLGSSAATQGNKVDDAKSPQRTSPDASVTGKLKQAVTTPGSLYAISSTANAVFVLDPRTLGLVTKIAVGTGPTRGAIGTDNTTLYVTNKQSDSISVIDMPSNTVKSTIALNSGSKPTGIAANDTSLFVINSALNSISQVDIASQKVVATFSAGTQAIAMTPDGLLFWVANSDNTVTVFDALTNESVKTITGITNPTAIAFTRDGTTAYVVSGAGSLFALGTLDYKVIKSVSVGSNPVAVATDVFETIVYVANHGSGTVTVLNRDDLSFVGNLNVPSPPNTVIGLQ